MVGKKTKSTNKIIKINPHLFIFYTKLKNIFDNCLYYIM